MIQNLKIDIIYYDTPSDFEFEFNLGGCCHSRVLNSKTSSPKEMIGCLSKAVGRSRVILIVGKLNESDGLFSLISKAIGLPLEEVDADQYGIVPNTNTTIISGALPLISTDGLLAGCIIESGPQSIILLSESKALRKDVAENLVFQYITAVSRTPDTETVVTPDSTAEEIPSTQETDESEEILVAEEEIAPTDTEAQIEESTEEEIIKEIEIPEILSDTQEDTSEVSEETEDSFSSEEESLPEREEVIEIYTDTEEESGADINNDYIYNIPYEQPHSDDEYQEQDNTPSKKGINTFIWILVGLLFIIAAVLIYMLVFTPMKNGVGVIDYISQVLNI